jgi:hypothetical protein
MMRSLDRAKPAHKKPWASLIAIAVLAGSHNTEEETGLQSHLAPTPLI